MGASSFRTTLEQGTETVISVEQTFESPNDGSETLGHVVVLPELPTIFRHAVRAAGVEDTPDTMALVLAIDEAVDDLGVQFAGLSDDRVLFVVKSPFVRSNPKLAQEIALRLKGGSELVRRAVAGANEVVVRQIG